MCVGRGRESTGGTDRCDGAVDPQRRAETLSGRRLLRTGHRARHRARGHAVGARGVVTSREKLADDLARARARTLRLVDFDDAELFRQYNPLMSPLVWDLAHIGQQEELWLLRGGDPDRPGILPPAVEGLYDAFEHSRASRVDLPLLSPEQARSYCRTVRSATLDALDALPDDPAGEQAAFVYGMVVSHENQHDETMLQALNLRTGAPLLREPANLPAGRPAVAGTSVLVPAGPFVLGVDAASEPLFIGQRTSRPRRRPAGVPDRPGSGHQWRVATVHRRRRLRRAAMVVPARLGAPPERGPHRAAVLELRRADARPIRPPRRHSPRRAGAACQLLRGRGLRGLGRRPAAHRGRNGRRPAHGIRRPTPGAATRGGRRIRRTTSSTWAARRCARHPSAHIPRARRPTG